jgi:vacuolar-type H+-ATPase subunit F/Vma7
VGGEGARAAARERAAPGQQQPLPLPPRGRLDTPPLCPPLTPAPPRPAPPHPLRAETTRDTIESTFARFLTRGDVGLIIMNQPVADSIRASVTAHTAAIPMVLEIPSKDSPYEPGKDAIMKRVLQMLGEA